MLPGKPVKTKILRCNSTLSLHCHQESVLAQISNKSILKKAVNSTELSKIQSFLRMLVN